MMRPDHVESESPYELLGRRDGAAGASPSSGLRQLGASLILLTLAAISPSFAQPTPRIVNGTLTSSFASTGALLIYNDATQTQLDGLCSGTLIGCRTFVTAAHCVCGDTETAATCGLSGAVAPERLRVFFQQAGLVQVAAIAVNPDFEFGEGGDIAVVQLAEPVVGIVATAINTVGKPDIDTEGTIVGFGRTINDSTLLSDAGIKREGKVTVADCNRVVPNRAHVCWQFLGTQSSTCSGDSGGPLFIDFGDGPLLAGVTSGGMNGTCEAPDRSFDTNVFLYADWLTQQIDDCASVTPTDEELFILLSTDGELGRASSEARFDLAAPAGTTALRFALNGQLSGADFDLYVRGASEPSTTTYDCADIATSSFGACAPITASAGTWHVLVRRVIGSGTFQLNVTALVDPRPRAICSGDCDADGAVSVGDLVTGVNALLGHSTASSCASLDANSDGTVMVDELVDAVANALSGCAQ